MSRFIENTHHVSHYTLEHIDVAKFLDRLNDFVSKSIPLLLDAINSEEYMGNFNLYVGKVGIALAMHRAQQKIADHHIPYSNLPAINPEEKRKARKQSGGIGLTSDYLAVDLYNCLRNSEHAHIDEEYYTGSDLQEEFLNGHAGFALIVDYFTRKGLHFTNPKLIRSVLAQIPIDRFPWEWNGERYYGAAHGTSGILLALRRFGDGSRSYLDLYRQLISSARIPSSGNFLSSEGSTKDKLVQWCHGATGFIPLLYEYHEELQGEERDENRQIIEEALEVCWTRGILTKGSSICHGIAGNAYPFLMAYIHSPERNHKCFAQAIAFAHEILTFGPLHCCREADRPFSLFEGLAGVVHFMLDVMEIVQMERQEEEKIRRFILYDGLRIFN
jgi:hypothetical protein